MRLRSVVLALALAVLLAQNGPALLAQESRASILGRISDSTGGVIPGAEIKATNLMTGTSAEALTNDEGNYQILYLVPGKYRVLVTMSGFKQHIREDIELRVADALRVDAVLEVGEVSETIVVSGQTAVLESTSASLGQVLDARRMQELPIRDGSPVELVGLAAGVVNTTDLRLRKPAFNNGLSQIATDGAAQYANEFAIDGVPNTANNRVAYSPPASAVGEFRVQTSTYDAGLGHTIGAVVNMISSSGTNDFHGEGHEWIRNSALDANSFFDNAAGNKKKVYQDNRFGFSMGGPVLIPGLYNGKNRTFWFFTFEANPFEVPRSQVLTIPTARQLAGDFSDLLTLGSNYQIYDPATTRPAAESGRFQRDPLAGNLIPPDRISPVAKKIMAYWPQPNLPGTSDGGSNYQVPDLVDIETYRIYSGRVDHNISDRHRLYFRFSFDYWEEEKRHWYHNIANGIFLNRNNRLGTIDDVYVFSPSLVLNVRYGYTRQLFPQRRRSSGLDLKSLGFSDSLVSLVPPGKGVFPRITFATYSGGFGEYEGTGDGHFNTDIHSIGGAVSWLKGNHSLRFGSEGRAYRENSGNFPTDYAPQFSFGTTWTNGPKDNSPAAKRGQDLAAFLMGYLTPNASTFMSVSSTYAEQSTWMSLFVHDDWKISRRLTLNLGLRYELDNSTTERFDRMTSGFDFNTALPIEAEVRAAYATKPIAEIPADQFRVRGGLLFAGVNGRGRGLWERDNRNIMPRIGLAYQLDSRTVLRAGYGIFFDTLGVNRVDANQNGYSRRTLIVPSLDNGQTFVATFANPLPNGLLQPFGNSLGLMTDVGDAVNFGYANPRNPYASRWSLGIQRELPGHVVVEASYVGNRGVALPVTRNFNAVPGSYLSTKPTRDNETNSFLTSAVSNPFYPLLPGTTLAGKTVQRQQLLRPYPQFGAINAVTTAGASWFHSLQTRLERRMANGFTVSGAYTFGKSMEATSYLNDSDWFLEHVISANDRTHVLSASGIYELPFGRGRLLGSQWHPVLNHAFGGWQISAICRSQSGAPLQFGNFILKTSLDDVVLPKDQRTVGRWFNTDAFEKDPNKQLVSNRRVLSTRFAGIRAPGYILWDVSALKNIAITEEVTLQLRIEAYNAFNRANFQAPATGTATSSTFGAITAQNGLARQFQLAARVMF
ncbi:MAG: carboxypeptidase regulatory-like domain-containing protein [Acidobacteriota bacterium]